MSEERSVRDRLAEAFWRWNFGISGWSDDGPLWLDVPPHEQEQFAVDAEEFLRELPTVGLVLTSSEDTTQTRQVQGGGE